MDDEDSHEEIERLEDQIDELAAKIESCRKFILAGRIAAAGGGMVLITMLAGTIRLDPSMLGDALPAPTPQSAPAMRLIKICSMLVSL